LRAILLLGVSVCAATSASAQGTTLPAFDVQLTTNRGCIETGQNPVFAVGDPVRITFRIGSGVVSRASATLYDTLPNNVVKVFSLGQVPTNATIGVVGLAGTPTGRHQLLLSADAQGVRRTGRRCSFTVGSAQPTTPSPTATRRPMTRTSTPTRTATPVAPAALDPIIRTNRGCIESGDDPVFAVGEFIQVSFRVNSTTRASANMSIIDRASNGSQLILSFGTLSTNVTRRFFALVGFPTGTEVLTLRASASGVTAEAACSFRVVTSPAPTLTKTRAMTATRTASRTPTRTRTPVVAPPSTHTPTRTPVSDCAGACTTPGQVTITDLMLVLQIAAGEVDVSACPAADANGDGSVALVEVLLAVSNALEGCPPAS
jgi:hypothetical protein